MKEIQTILEHLGGKKWEDHPVPTLVSAQGKLAILSSNLAQDVQEKRHVYDLMELNAKDYEAQQYLENRVGNTEGEAKAMARLEASDKWKEVLRAKKAWKDAEIALQSVERAIIACQVSLKHAEQEMINTKYHGNG